MFTINNTSLLEGSDAYTIESGFTVNRVTSKTGHTFAGWSGDNKETNAKYSGKTINIPVGTYGDIDLYATWTTDEFTLTFVTNGGNKISAENHKYGEEVELPTPTKDGYSFNGWYKDGNLSVPVDDPFIMPAENTTIYADWTANQYKITFNTNDGTWTNPNITDPYQMTFDYKESLSGLPTEADISRKGYKFVGWYKDANGTIAISDEMDVIGGFTAYAKWDIISYNIVLSGIENATYNGSTRFTYTIKNPTFTLNTPTKEGYSFNGWTSADIEYNSQTKVYNVLETSIGKDITITANWTVKKYTITFNTNGGTTIASITKDYGDELIAPANPTKSGYTFGGWYEDSQFQTEFHFDDYPSMPARNITLFAYWSKGEFTITFDSNDGSSVTSIKAKYEDTISKPADPTKTGYTFAGWYENEELSGNQYEFNKMPAKNFTLYAKWSAIKYTITYYDFNINEPENVNSTIELKTYTIEDEIVLPTPTKAGYVFKNWGEYEVAANGKLESPISNNNQTFTIKKGSYGDIKIEIGWSLEQDYTISYDFNGWSYAEGVAYPTKYNVESGTADKPLKLITPTRLGYEFTGWSGTGLDGENNMEVTIPKGSTGNREYVAHWKAIEYTITYVVGDGQIDENAPKKYTIEQEVSIPNATNANSEFSGWKIEGYNNINKAEVNKNGNGLTVIPTGTYGHLTFTASYGSKISVELTAPTEGTEIIYDGNPHAVKTIVKLNNEVIDITSDQYKDKILITYSYTNTLSEVSTSDGAVNAGTYNVTATVNFAEGSGYSLANEPNNINITIKPRPILASEIGIDYNANYRLWADIYANQVNVTFTNNDAEKTTLAAPMSLSKDDYYISALTDGGSINVTANNKALSINGNFVGNTYLATISLNDTDNAKNYVFADVANANKPYLKYKTAKIGETYFTIEDAINQGSGTISFAGNATKDSTYVETHFNELHNIGHYPYGSTLEYTLSGRTMIVPFENSTLEKTIDNNNYTTFVYSALVINSAITLNVNSGTLVAGAYMTQGTPNLSVTNQRGVIVNNGNINLSSSTIISYGYVKGSGTINLEDNSNAIDVLRCYDWPGGVNGLSISSTAFPINNWTVHNISCDLLINSGSTLEAYAYVAVSYQSYNYDIEETITLIGNSSSTYCMFKPSTSGGTDYVVKTSSIGGLNQESITYNNQSSSDYDIVTLYGSFVDSTLYICALDLLFVKFDFKTSKSISLPICSLDVTLAEGSKMTLSNSDYNFFDGMDFTVEKGAELNISSGVDLAFNSSSYFIVDGEVNCDGSIGGNIITYNDDSSSKLDLSNGSATASYTTINGTEAATYSTTATGRIYSNGSIQNGEFEKYVYHSKNKGWISSNTSFNINYEHVLPSGYTTNDIITDNIKTSYKVSDALTLPNLTSNRLELQFMGYYLDSNCSNKIDIIYGNEYLEDITLYAKWVVGETVTIEYKYIIGAGVISDSSQYSIHKVNILKGADYEIIAPIANKEGYTFSYWKYNNEQLKIGDAIYNVDCDYVLVAEYSINQYTITFNTDGGSTINSITANYGSTISKPKNPTKSGYDFDGWDKEIPSTMPAQNLTITAKWKEVDTCLVEGTLITMADGTKKKIEELSLNDQLLVFNHKTGLYESSSVLSLWHTDQEASCFEIIKLKFSSDLELEIVGKHGLFDLDLKKYVFISKNNINEFISHKFAATDSSGNTINVILESYIIYNKKIKIYSPVSEYHLNVIANSMLTMTPSRGNEDAIFNIFKYDADMKYNIESMNEDISRYGLYTYEDFAEYIPYEIFINSPIKYFKISVEKGYITFEDILKMYQISE